MTRKSNSVLIAVGEVGGVNETESGGSEQFPFLAFAGGGFDQYRGIPLAEIDFQALQLEPAFEQINLGGFARAIQAFDGDKAAREVEFGERFHLLTIKVSVLPMVQTMFFGGIPKRGAVAWLQRSKVT